MRTNKEIYDILDVRGEIITCQEVNSYYESHIKYIKKIFFIQSDLNLVNCPSSRISKIN